MLQQFLFCLDVVCAALVYLSQFFRADFGGDNGILFRFCNGVADTVHNIIRTVLGCIQGIKGCPFTLGGAHQTAVYAVQFFLDRIDFFEQVAQGYYLAVDLLKQVFKFLHILFQFLFGCIIVKPFP